MKKILIPVLILILSLFVSACSHSGAGQSTKAGMSGMLSDSDWAVATRGGCVTFEEPGKEKGYYEWDMYHGKNKCGYAGTYHLYEWDDSETARLEQEMKDNGKDPETVFADYLQDLENPKPIALIIDLQDNVSSGSETGMETHLEYYGLYDGDDIVMCRPGRDDVRKLSKY